MKSERIGLTLILATRAVIGASVVLLLERDRDTRLSQIEHQGAALVGVLSRMPLAVLTPAGGRQVSDVSSRGTD